MPQAVEEGGVELENQLRGRGKGMGPFLCSARGTVDPLSLSFPIYKERNKPYLPHRDSSCTVQYGSPQPCVAIENLKRS